MVAADCMLVGYKAVEADWVVVDLRRQQAGFEVGEVHYCLAVAERIEFALPIVHAMISKLKELSADAMEWKYLLRLRMAGKIM